MNYLTPYAKSLLRFACAVSGVAVVVLLLIYALSTVSECMVKLPPKVATVYPAAKKWEIQPLKVDGKIYFNSKAADLEKYTFRFEPVDYTIYSAASIRKIYIKDKDFTPVMKRTPDGWEISFKKNK